MMDAYEKLGLINGETASEDLVNKYQRILYGKISVRWEKEYEYVLYI